MQKANLDILWVYLTTSPLAGLSMTLVAYLFAYWVQKKSNSHPLANTVLISVIIIVVALQVSHTSYQDYFEGAQFIHFLLGPATVALAIPLYRQLEDMRSYLLPVFLSVTAGIVAGTFSIIVISRALGADIATQMSLSVRSVTAPVAMGIAEQIGGIASLAVVMVLITGVFGAIFGGKILRLLGIKSDMIIAIAMGNNSHGIGTARAFTINQRKGAYAALAMALAVVLNALLLPWIVTLV
jgi:putative effector of murein hydrolase